MNSLKAKIRGTAKVNLSRFSLSTWSEIKNAILTTYGDKRDSCTLTIEICNIFAKKIKHSKKLKPCRVCGNMKKSNELGTYYFVNCCCNSCRSVFQRTEKSSTRRLT
uniref:Uncharacterized protein n=1 Tax=Cacopsylla melanoneura TaxID=428564 RepID=A0A8D9E8E4_9HEMI